MAADEKDGAFDPFGGNQVFRGGVRTARPGDKVTITGESFGEAGCVNMVSFGPGGAAKFTHVDDRTITVTVPEGKKGMEFLTVTGATSQDTKPFLRK